jgi:hypothetical protein
MAAVPVVSGVACAGLNAVSSLRGGALCAFGRQQSRVRVMSANLNRVLSIAAREPRREGIGLASSATQCAMVIGGGGEWVIEGGGK